METPSRAPATARGLRSLLVVVLVLAGAVGTTAAPVAWWVRGLVTSPNRYVATVQPLDSDTALRALVTSAVTDQVSTDLDVGSVTALQLPPGLLQSLSGQATVTDLLHVAVSRAVDAAVGGPSFATLWASLNRTAHPGVAALLTGSGPLTGSGARGRSIYRSGSDVVLNTAVIVQAVKTQLISDGLGIASRIPDTGTTVVLARIGHLSRVQAFVRLLDRTQPWLPWASGGCFLLAVVVARRRRLVLVVSGLSIVAAMGALTAARILGRPWIAARVAADGAHRQLVRNSVTILTRPLERPVEAVAAIGLALAILGLLAMLVRTGPDRQAARPDGGWAANG